jgi:endo-1,4-beta-xylanase
MAQLDPGEDSLREAAVRNGLLFGTALCASDLSQKDQCDAIVQECNMVTPEFEMKWDVIARAPHAPDYRASDHLAEFASGNGLALHGHTVWWHGAIPEWLGGAPDRQFAEAAIEHLEAVVSRYSGRMYSWDVVNEPLEPSHGCQAGLRQSRFLEALGPGYIGAAYRAAAALDPKAMLVLNEMGLEYASPDADRKRRMMLALLERELAAGAPIACLGLQSHLVALEQPSRNPDLREFLREVRQLGLRVMITEMDVSDIRCPSDPSRRDAIVADTYRAHIELVLEESDVTAVSTWGLTDRKSWLNSYSPRPDHQPMRPLPLDATLARKPAWHAIRAALLSTGRANETAGLTQDASFEEMDSR